MTDSETIEQILDDFDFERVKVVMDLLERVGGGPSPLSYNQLRRTAKGLLGKVVGLSCKPGSFSASGGLYAIRYHDGVSLEFVVARSFCGKMEDEPQS